MVPTNLMQSLLLQIVSEEAANLRWICPADLRLCFHFGASLHPIKGPSQGGIGFVAICCPQSPNQENAHLPAKLLSLQPFTCTYHHMRYDKPPREEGSLLRESLIQVHLAGPLVIPSSRPCTNSLLGTHKQTGVRVRVLAFFSLFLSLRFPFPTRPVPLPCAIEQVPITIRVVCCMLFGLEREDTSC